MNKSVQESLAIRSTAEDLRKQGYAVTVEPASAVIPFDLKQYRPDILASRGDENLIIDIKARGSRRSIERYKEIAEIVGSHKNWRFMLSTVDETEPDGYTAVGQRPDTDSLGRMLGKIDLLLSGENYDLAIPYLWLVYVSALRIVGERAKVPMDETSDGSVLNYLYSMGELSADEYELAKNFLALRNKTAHRLDVEISKETVLELYRHTQQKLHEYDLVQ